LTIVRDHRLIEFGEQHELSNAADPTGDEIRQQDLRLACR
jgi:hypothetical protein